MGVLNGCVCTSTCACLHNDKQGAIFLVNKLITIFTTSFSSLKRILHVSRLFNFPLVSIITRNFKATIQCC